MTGTFLLGFYTFVVLLAVFLGTVPPLMYLINGEPERPERKWVHGHQEFKGGGKMSRTRNFGQFVCVIYIIILAKIGFIIVIYLLGIATQTILGAL